MITDDELRRWFAAHPIEWGKPMFQGSRIDRLPDGFEYDLQDGNACIIDLGRIGKRGWLVFIKQDPGFVYTLPPGCEDMYDALTPFQVRAITVAGTAHNARLHKEAGTVW